MRTAVNVLSTKCRCFRATTVRWFEGGAVGVRIEGDQKGTRIMKSMHLVTCSA
jgi:hypothetical protein